MKGDTHLNILFVTDQNAFMGLDLPVALREGRKQKGFIFWNHPGWKQTAAWFPDIAALYDEKLIDGVELVNGRDSFPQAFPWIEEKRLTILSNSDTHAPTLPGYADRSRPLTLVFARTPIWPGSERPSSRAAPRPGWVGKCGGVRNSYGDCGKALSRWKARLLPTGRTCASSPCGCATAQPCGSSSA
jgi:hypothetical protein